MENNNTFDLKAALRSMKVVHFALVNGLFFFLIVDLLLLYSGGVMLDDKEFAKNLLYALLVLSAAGLWFGGYIFKKKINSGLPEKKNLEEKLLLYREAMIMRTASWEVPAFAGCVFFMMTGGITFAVIAVFFMVVMVLARPTAAGIVRDLGLEGEEARQLLPDRH